VKLFGGAEYKLSNQVAMGAGMQFERGHVKERDRTRDYTLLGAPLFARRDSSNDLLNPTDGDRQQITITPYFPVSKLPGFVQAKANASIYRKLGPTDRYVLAAFAGLGATAGIKLDDLPKDKRLYAGGGGSVRGYAYQRAGDIDGFGDPVGGRSSVEMGVEMRVKVTESIGIVPFVDAGRAYESQLPTFKSLLVSAGLGGRYYTAIGPVRLDVAVPLKKRSDDGSFQLYVSLGQAF
jgi:translocation and assembly module TamA